MKFTHMELTLVLVITLASVAAAAGSHALPGCIDTCGNVSIPYPFGVGTSSITGKKCFLGKPFHVTCKDSILQKGNIRVLNISLSGQVDLLFFVSKLCYNRSEGKGNELPLYAPSFTISSTENKFVSVGCDTYGFLTSYQNGTGYSTGCLTRCLGISDMQIMQNDGHCSGAGCCQVDIPIGMKNITVDTNSFTNFNVSLGFSNCSYSFIAKKDSYKFSVSHLKHLPFDKIPLVADWAVVNETCQVSQNSGNYACTNHSHCEDMNTTYGYRCRCNTGYEGNPYHPDGCQDIDECKTSNHSCTSYQNCRNVDGSYECFCPDEPCQQIHRENPLSKIAIGVFSSLGSIISLFGLWWLFKVVREKRVKKLREKIFKRNGGLLLEQRISSGEANADKAKHFNLKDLEKATDNFNRNRILGKGGQGTVYKGMLVDGRIVAVKKFRVQGNIDEFINEFVILSQINHRNVVSLMGCCLETEIPLLVYEFIPNGNLFEYLHEQNEDLPITWDMRLRIAAEVAGALFYLHSAASQPIYHRDIKSTNILLDEKYMVKVADFGASRMISIENTHLTTVVQGTFGYLDPEYFHTSQFTEKSDVYSFGVVLVELLTGQKPISSLRPQEFRSLASYFVLSMEDENRLFDIIDERVTKEGEKEHIIAVANLANRCLDLNGKKRPTMKEVTMELEGIRNMIRQSNAQQNHEVIALAANEDHLPWVAYCAPYTWPTIDDRATTSEVVSIPNK